MCILGMNTSTILSGSLAESLAVRLKALGSILVISPDEFKRLNGHNTFYSLTNNSYLVFFSFVLLKYCPKLTVQIAEICVHHSMLEP